MLTLKSSNALPCYVTSKRAISKICFQFIVVLPQNIFN